MGRGAHPHPGAHAAKHGEKLDYTIVGPAEANPRASRISNESPVGKALMGKKKGDKVRADTPGGVEEFTILKVE